MDVIAADVCDMLAAKIKIFGRVGYFGDLSAAGRIVDAQAKFDML